MITAIQIEASEAHNAFIVHDKESHLAQLPSWISVSYSPYNHLCEYVSEIQFGEPTLEKLEELWQTRCLYNSYPTNREVYNIARRVYATILQVFNDKLYEISGRMFAISSDYGNAIRRKSKFWQYGTITSWGIFTENTSDEEIRKTLMTYF